MPRIWYHLAPRATTEPKRAHALHNAPMIPKPLQFLLLVPLAFGTMAPRFFLGLFLLALLGLALWWLHLVATIVFGE